ncbi:hypothetical protein DMN91_007514 [Ooceraea biroi]|uniref:AB hydrolase-1 domain-containing protein n=1 Tax=Ooceraea biroi TaxID=2015173 RepID=A0A3L8DKE8_OOCBI|nr:hypothetical protein DMN91_007514 [Ooceraea biroi]
MANTLDYEGDDNIIAHYENEESDGERRSLGEAEEATSDNETGTARRIDPSTATRTHVIRNPAPKLNTERLKGPNGIQIIEKYFEAFKFYDEAYEAALSNAKQPVFLYMHGNSGNRASAHRLELYKLFQDMDYHVICFDYRSYGDSDIVELSEAGVVADSKYVVEWVLKKVNGSAPVFVWGHSLGTGTFVAKAHQGNHTLG